MFHAVDRVMEGGHEPRRFAADLLDRLRDLIGWLLCRMRARTRCSTCRRTGSTG